MKRNFYYELRRHFDDWRFPWTGDKIKHRHYKSYDKYVAHQNKIDRITPEKRDKYDTKYHSELRARLQEHGCPSGVVLCLAARFGSEVKAFQDFGNFAIGLDLYPGTKNKYVMYGDFHEIQFPDQSVDVIFSNSLDHALYIEKVVSEIKRLLRSGGTVILETGVIGETVAGPEDVSYWDTPEDLLKLFLPEFELEKRYQFRLFGKAGYMNTCVYLKKNKMTVINV